MQLYLKILGFIKPYWKSILLSLLCTFLYVFFNNLSLWISVDFVQELFSPEYVNETLSTDPEVDPGTSNKELKLEKLFDLTSDFDVYTTINYHIKALRGVRLINIKRDGKNTRCFPGHSLNGWYRRGEVS